jgi:hypothetical protein
MSRKGNCWDNAVAESFFSTLEFEGPATSTWRYVSDGEPGMFAFIELDLIRADIRHKHQMMASGAFPFFRATFYRWMQVWPESCSDLADAPVVLAVGDLHVENFETWRDQEGRLVWGVNDFDEAFPPWV